MFLVLKLIREIGIFHVLSINIFWSPNLKNKWI